MTTPTQEMSGQEAPPVRAEPLAVIRTDEPIGRGTLLGIGLALLAGAGLVVGALSFQRPPPVEAAHAQGLDVKSEGEVDVVAGGPQWKVLKLGQVERARGSWTDPVPGRVKIDERRSSKVGTPLSGRVTDVLVDLGQHVHAGDPLFRVSSPDLAELRAQKRKADVDLHAAEIVLERVKAMVAGHAVAAKEELSATQQLEQAKVSKQLAESKLTALRVAPAGDDVTEIFVVTAPQDGVIVEKNLVAHQEVTPESGSSLFVVADLSEVWVVADLFESDVGEVREGTRAEITLARVSAEPITAVVDTVSAIVDPGRHTVPIRVRVPNDTGLLRPNAFASVRFATEANALALSIPATAIVSDGAKQYVYVWSENHKFLRRDVVAGACNGGRVDIVRGLSEGETVLVEGAILLDNQMQLATGT